MVSICIAAYNEEKNIRKILRYLENQLLEIDSSKKTKIIICLNGCNDKTKKIVKEISKKFQYPLVITHSEKGKLKAHKKMLEFVDEKEIVFFMDADVLVPKETIIALREEFEKDDYVKIVSAYPYVIKMKNLPPYKDLIFNVLNLKRIYPKIEVAKNNVSMYHSSNKEFNKKSRIYFHGRFFAIRNKSIYDFPRKKSKIRGDDTFLSRIILDKYGKGSINVLFGSKVYCAPLMSIRSYLKSWYRIRKDIDEINLEYPKFKKFNRKVIMKLNWKYLKTLPLEVKFYALCFSILRKYEALSYKIIKKKIDLDNIWSYDKKEVVEEIK